MNGFENSALYDGITPAQLQLCWRFCSKYTVYSFNRAFSFLEIVDEYLESKNEEESEEMFERLRQ